MIPITLYEPTDPPEIPRKKIGKALISNETWERIGGVGQFAGQGRMKTFSLMHRPQMFAHDFDPTGAAAQAVTFHRIICESIPIWRNGRYTFNWRAVVPSEEDRKKVVELAGTWEG